MRASSSTDVCSKNPSAISGCMSCAIAWTDFLQNSGNCPCSLRMPPSCPPMRSAQVLQEFRDIMCRQNSKNPPCAFSDWSNVYLTACHPPPRVTLDMNRSLVFGKSERYDRRRGVPQRRDCYLAGRNSPQTGLPDETLTA